MSILSALFPLALSVSPQALAAPVTLAPEPVALPVATAPAAKPIEVKFAPPAAKPAIKPAPAVARPGDADLIKIQAPVAMKLKADSVQGGFVLNGTKFWITNAPYADTLVVYAKTAPESGSRWISAFLIEKYDEGFSIGQKIDKMGMRGSPTAELVFNDCFVPEDRIMGPLHGGVGVLMSGLDYERVVLAGLQLGVMQACLDVVLPYVRERKQFGKAIGTFQLMQAKVADMYVALNSA